MGCLCWSLRGSGFSGLAAQFSFQSKNSSWSWSRSWGRRCDEDSGDCNFSTQQRPGDFDGKKLGRCCCSEICAKTLRHGETTGANLPSTSKCSCCQGHFPAETCWYSTTIVYRGHQTDTRGNDRVKLLQSLWNSTNDFLILLATFTIGSELNLFDAFLQTAINRAFTQISMKCRTCACLCFWCGPKTTWSHGFRAQRSTKKTAQS